MKDISDEKLDCYIRQAMLELKEKEAEFSHSLDVPELFSKEELDEIEQLCALPKHEFSPRYKKEISTIRRWIEENYEEDN